MSIFDFFRDLFSGIFGDGDDDITSWGGDGDNVSWSYDVDGSDFSDMADLEERLIEMPDTGTDATIAGAEYVQEFYDLQAVLDYVEGTPANILQIAVDPEENIYYVYRFASD